MLVLGALAISAEAAWGQQTRGQITVRGTIESAESVEIRCEVPSQQEGGTTILWIVPEGTDVEKGDELVRLDSSDLAEKLSQQRVACAVVEAELMAAQVGLQMAELELAEFAEGVYPLEKMAIEHEIVACETELSFARRELASREKLAADAAIATTELEATRAKVVIAGSKLARLRKQLDVLEKFTRPATLKRLEIAVASAKAKLAATAATREMTRGQLHRTEDQLARCEIKAPKAGQVIYASPIRRSGSVVGSYIRQGSRVRQRQPLLRLIDPERMQVRAMVRGPVKKGTVVSIRIDAIPDVKLKGVVDTVVERKRTIGGQSQQTSEITVQMHKPPTGLRVGMTAEVRLE